MLNSFKIHFDLNLKPLKSKSCFDFHVEIWAAGPVAGLAHLAQHGAQRWQGISVLSTGFRDVSEKRHWDFALFTHNNALPP